MIDGEDEEPAAGGHCVLTVVSGSTTVCSASERARTGSRSPGPGISALAAAAPSAAASASGQPWPISSVLTSPARNASPLPTGYRPTAASDPCQLLPSGATTTAPS